MLALGTSKLKYIKNFNIKFEYSKTLSRSTPTNFSGIF